ncbi:DUF58 domain-containing protein [candidate division KSB1 bacterium]|nr:DUF58 domain-containing protein [candidate division KSB1 bacterium]
MPDKSENYNRYLDPHYISTISGLDLRAKLVVEGFMAGLHKSPYHGFSVEFAEHRQYMPGDELKHVDWKVYGKTNRFYVKQFEEETNLKCYLLLDCSASMSYASGPISKFTYANYLAAALAYLMIRHQRDAVGLVTFDEKICTIMPARSMSSYLSDILRTLDQTQTTEGTNIASALNTIAERIKRRALVLIFSDFFDEDLEAVLQGLKHFRHRKHEVVLFHMLDAQEINFGFTEDTLFIDMESDEKLRTQPVHIKRSYQQLFNEFLSTIKQSCRDQNIDYVPMSTDKPFDYALMNYLQKRRRIGG